MRICYVCGARPNFMKIAAIVRAGDRHPQFSRLLVHTGQHYDERMCRVLFDDLQLPRPDVDLGVGSGSHGVQTAEILKGMESVLGDYRPDLVLVVGDTNSTVSAALAAVKLQLPVAHVEAGLRSFDRDMPEEINRVITDAISDLLLVSEPSGMENLRREGVPDECCHFVGNVMIDTLLAHRERAERSGILDTLGVTENQYAVLTLHRPANVDDPVILEQLLGALGRVGEACPVVFPVHPRTRKQLGTHGLLADLLRRPQLHLCEPLGYLDFVKLMSRARVILTDSGGIQEEATILERPCLTLRPNTERPATVTSGYNRVIGCDPEAVSAAFEQALTQPRIEGRTPERWDGRAGDRIFDLLRGMAATGVPRRHR
ncbi:MAG: non-hydrolyzing UDP-N-acetylglucosamine 2-epimerase [Planctomycetota bacterium]